MIQFYLNNKLFKFLNNTNFSKTILSKVSFLILFIIIHSLFGCTKNEYIIDDNRTNNSKSKNLVYFVSRMENNFTRVLTPFPQYCKAQIFAFTSGGDEQSVTSPIYRSASAGTLTPTNKPMILTDGEYNFYAVSSKEDSLPPTFINNYAVNLQNGKDYLWCSIKNQIIDKNGTTVPITFNHVATQLIVNIENKDNINPLSEILDAAYSAPIIDENVKWNLLTGIISPATSISTNPFNLSIKGLKTSTIMVPLYAPTDSIGYYVAVKQENGDLQLCSTLIPIPEEGYQAGHSYEYVMYFDADSLMLGLVTVAPWEEDVVSDDVEAN